ncbi:trehalose-phosphatase [Fulvivirga sp. 29W222]|uniref:Trehalose 6-phosphate phosphatase n=1 Tax=Fulvivirga marina TaxID=2494733 RepID=A0A937G047_9BACT|nr:trehalose-phosphatase [Fulvivirga marina]MBL6447681.1 trehalose-phosphatase [Fulvivirga marina]
MKKKIDSLLCDLDGVLTKTADLHARAWKLLFDDLLEQASEGTLGVGQKFVIATDYPKFIDGKPRLEGIRSYLKARKLDIPEGDKDDPAEMKTVHGLGKKKNQLFHKLLNAEGVKIYAASIKAITAWKNKGLKIAVVSSSKNCLSILQSAGIEQLFDAIVDGNVAQEKGLAGKPEPDVFLYAAFLLQTNPKNAAVAEDAAVGIEAAKRGKFALSIGILKENNARILLKSEADVTVRDLSEITYTGESMRYPLSLEKLDHACLSEYHISRSLQLYEPVFFFDYDGTLTPIVAHPEDALLSQATRERLKTLSERASVAVISGRDKDDVKKLVGLENIFYAGSHGFDIEGPGSVTHHVPHAQDIMRSVIKATALLQEKLQATDGVQIEPKKFAVAVHYRNTPKDLWQEVREVCQQVADQFSNLKNSEGKMVMELRPDVDWDKGKAMEWVAGKLGVQSPQFHYFYMGDDFTDEDAFRALPENGTGILVGSHEGYTYADYHVKGPEEIDQLLTSFINIIQKHRMDV